MDAEQEKRLKQFVATFVAKKPPERYGALLALVASASAKGVVREGHDKGGHGLPWDRRLLIGPGRSGKRRNKHYADSR